MRPEPDKAADERAARAARLALKARIRALRAHEQEAMHRTKVLMDNQKLAIELAIRQALSNAGCMNNGSRGGYQVRQAVLRTRGGAVFVHNLAICKRRLPVCVGVYHAPQTASAATNELEYAPVEAIA